MATTILDIYTNDRYVYTANKVTFILAHDAANGTAVYSNPSYMVVGQLFQANKYSTYRGIAVFNTASIPITDNILSAQIRFDCIVNPILCDLSIVSGSDVVSPAVIADFGRILDNITVFGNIAQGDIISGENFITLNQQGINAINKGGLTTFALRSSEDIDNIAPTTAHEEILLTSWSPPASITFQLIIVHTPPRLGTFVKDIVTLEALRNVEMSAQGRIYVDESGNLKYESRYARNP